MSNRGCREREGNKFSPRQGWGGARFEVGERKLRQSPNLEWWEKAGGSWGVGEDSGMALKKMNWEEELERAESSQASVSSQAKALYL